MVIFTLICLANLSAVNQHTLEMRLPDPYSQRELDTIKQYLFNNITTAERFIVKDDNGHLIKSIPGAVMASPSNKGTGFTQDYQFHWTRDAALVMKEVVYLYTQASQQEKKRLKSYLTNYINFERKAQTQVSRPGEQTLGQPKFNIDGTIWEGDWGRPQNDGAALRAITLANIANLFLQEGDEQYVRDVLINMVTTDLDYIVSEWQSKNYDLWEEVNDKDHFFNKMAQRKGLMEGSQLLARLGEGRRANQYLYVADQIQDSLNTHWNAGRGYFTETVNQQYYKGGGLNISIVLGVLHGDTNNPDDQFAVNNERVMSTVYYLRNAFSGLYRVNIDNHFNPPMLGRYPNDVYDGNQDEYGNPWPLTTNALGQYYYQLANVYLKQGKIVITNVNKLFFQQIDEKLGGKEEVILLTENPGKFYTIVNSLVEEGDKALGAVKHYATCYTDFSCMHFSEQIDRTSGKQVSARDLTWSYASALTAMQARYQLRE